MQEHFRGKVLFGRHKISTELHHVSELATADMFDFGVDYGSVEAALTAFCNLGRDLKDVAGVVSQAVLGLVLSLHRKSVERGPGRLLLIPCPDCRPGSSFAPGPSSC